MLKRKFATSLLLAPALLFAITSPAESHQFAHCYAILSKFQERDATTALASAEKKLRKNPNDMKALWVKGAVLQIQCRNIAAEQVFNTLLAAALKQHASKKELAVIHAELSFLQTNNGHGQEARASFDKSLAFDSTSPLSNMVRAWKLWQGMSKDALVEFDRYISLAKDEDSYVNKAHYLHCIGRSEDAFKTLADCEKKFPNSAFANFERAYMYTQKHDPANAEKCADLAQKKLHVGGYIFADIGTLYKKQGQIEKYLDALRKYALYWPCPESVSVLSTHLQQRGKFDEAAQVLDKAQARYPDVEEFADRKCKLYRMAGRWKEALAAAQYKIDHFKNAGEHSYLNRGICYEALGEYKKAIADFNKGIGTSPDKREILSRAKCYIAMKNYPQALDDADFWLKHHPGHITGLQLKAQALAGMGKMQEAVGIADSLLRNAQDSPDVIKLRAEILQKMGRGKEAAAEFTRAAKLRGSY